jgi:putative transposase
VLVAYALGQFDYSLNLAEGIWVFNTRPIVHTLIASIELKRNICMFDNDELLRWFKSMSLSENAQSIIRNIVDSDPARRVQSGRSNVSGRYPSKKMGVTIQFESHHCELPFVIDMENDIDVLAYLDQPPSFKIEFKGKRGRRQVIIHTSDFFEIRKSMAGWVEIKTEDELLELAQTTPNRYCLDDEGQWQCPPGEAYAETYGLYYRVRTSKEIDLVAQRNYNFLDDYMRFGSPAITPDARQAILGHVSSTRNTTLEFLIETTRGVASPDDIYSMIVIGDIYVNLSATPLVEPEKVHVYCNKEIAIAHANIIDIPPDVNIDRPRFVDVCAGATVCWDGQARKVVNVGETMVGLLSEGNAFTEVPITTFEELIRGGRITGVELAPHPSPNPEVSKIFAEAIDDDFSVANFRHALVKRMIEGKVLPEDLDIPERTRRLWKASYLLAKEKWSNGYIGLLPRTRKRGSTASKLPEATWVLINDFIENDYETLKQKKIYEVWASLSKKCEEKGVVVPSYKTFSSAIKKRPSYIQTLKRKGRRAAYEHKAFYWRLDRNTPRHGDRPFEIVHIDHTEVDLEFVSSTNIKLGRAWLTIAIDAFSRRILAVYLTFDPPSYRSCMMVMREVVRRWGRLPQIIVVDGGPEFHSIYFETFCARYEITKKTRPPAEARFGSIGERIFGTLNTQFFHNLRGNTQITRNVRQVTKSVNPKGQAAWTIGRLNVRLKEFCYEVYDTNVHPALGASPRDAYVAGIGQTGNRPRRFIAYDEDFLMWTLPTTSKGTARIVPGRGAKINHLYYWHDSFRDPEVEGTQARVRFDPFDAGTAYVFVRGQWVRCHSEYHSIFHGRSERELMQASDELRARKRKHSQEFTITARKLADFLESVEAEEALLLQRLRDQESQSMQNSTNENLTEDNSDIQKTQVNKSDDNASSSEGLDARSSDTNDSENYGEFEK